ncbi:hypothetical protein PMAYCL1PPCAC_00452, partial [Pristionchus mayeri]
FPSLLREDAAIEGGSRAAANLHKEKAEPKQPRNEGAAAAAGLPAAITGQTACSVPERVSNCVDFYFRICNNFMKGKDPKITRDSIIYQEIRFASID